MGCVWHQNVLHNTDLKTIYLTLIETYQIAIEKLFSISGIRTHFPLDNITYYSHTSSFNINSLNTKDPKLFYQVFYSKNYIINCPDNLLMIAGNTFELN